MESCDNSSFLIRTVKILLRSLVFLFNAMLWISVLYLSVNDNEVAALLSYVTVTFTVVTMKYYLWGVINNSESVAFFIDFPSRILILAAIFLAFHNLWNTAFYSLCLGIILQKVKCEVEDRTVDFGPYEITEISSDNKTYCNDQSNSHNNFEDSAYEMQINENKVNSLKAGDFCTSISLCEKNKHLKNMPEKENMDVKQLKCTQKEGRIFPLQETHRSSLEIVNCLETISPEEDNCHGNPDDSNKRKNNLNYHNYSLKQNNLIADESSLKLKKCETQPDSELNNANTIKIQRDGILCTMKVHLFDLKELELNECSKLEFKYELNKDNIKRELKRNEENVDFGMKDEAVSNENLKGFLKDEANLSTSDRTKSISEFEGKENELSVGQVNVSSDVLKDSNDFYQNNSSKKIAFKQDEKIEINAKPVQLYENNMELFNKEITMSGANYQPKNYTNNVNSLNTAIESQCELQSEIENSEYEHTNMNSKSMETTNVQPEERTDESYQTKLIPEKTFNESVTICLGHEQIGEDFKTDFEINRNNLKEIDRQENVSQNNENCELEKKYGDTNCQSLKAVNANICQTKFISQQVNDGNLESVSEKRNEMFCQLESNVQPECLSKAKTFYNSKLNESANAEESTNTTEHVIKVSGNADTSQFTNVSNVEDVVNRIDLGFIYALGFDVPCVKYTF